MTLPDGMRALDEGEARRSGGCSLGCLMAPLMLMGVPSTLWVLLLLVAPDSLRVYAPVLCPPGTVSSRTDTWVEEDDEGTSTSWTLACGDASGAWTQVPTWKLLSTMFWSCECPALALGGMLMVAGGAIRRSRG